MYTSLTCDFLAKFCFTFSKFFVCSKNKCFTLEGLVIVEIVFSLAYRHIAGSSVLYVQLGTG